MRHAASIAALLLLAGSAAAGLSIESQVVGPDGKGLAGARVELRPVLRSYDQGLQELERKAAPEAAQTRSGPDGWFRFEVDSGGPWRLTVTAAGSPPLDSGPRMAFGEDTFSPARLGRVEGSSWHWLRPAVPAAPAVPETPHPWTLEVYDGGRPARDVLVRDRESLAVAGRTGADGAVLLASPTRESWALRIETRDGRIAFYDARPIPMVSKPEARVRRRFDLPPAVTYTGRVVDHATGKPIAGARVWPEEDPANFAVADAAGVYRLAWTPGTPVTLLARAEGYFLVEYSFRPEAPRKPAAGPQAGPALALWPARGLTGTVVRPDGRPLPGAEVRVFGENPDDVEEIGRSRTSTEGRFRLNVVEDGDYEVLAFAPGLAAASESVTLYPRAAGVSGIRLVVGPGRVASGRVVDERGRPVAGARVELARSQDGDLRPGGPLVDDGLYQDETGEDGRFEIRGLPEGWFDLLASRPQFLPSWLYGLEISGARADLGTVTLREGATLTGWIVGLNREPLAGAKVRLGSGEETVSGADGRFEIAQVDPGKELEIEACRPDRLSVSYESAKLPDEPVEIVLPPAVRLTGRVVDPDGKPAAEASVATSSDSNPNPFLGPSSPCPAVGRGEATTDAEGRFVLESLLGGTIQVWATQPGYLGSDFETVEVPDGGEAEVPTLQLARGATVTGRVLREDGSPAPAAQVLAAGEGDYSFSFSRWADGDGRYRIEGVPPGRQTITARHDTLGAGSREVELTVGGENQVDITLGPEESRLARGRVVDPDGEPVAGALVKNGQNTAYTGPDGAFSIPVDENGYELVARKDGYAPAYLTHWAAGGAREGLELRLGPEASVSGRLLGFDPADLAETRVSAYAASSTLQIVGLVSSDGTYQIRGLWAGEWLVSANLGNRSADARVEIAPEDPDVLQDLSLPGRVEVRGRVVDASGAPAAGVDVRLAVVGGEERTDYESQYQAISGEDGVFSMEAEDGTYELIAWQEDSGLTSGGRFTVAGEPVDGLEIRLAPRTELTGLLLGVPEEELSSVEVRIELGSFGSAAEIETGEEGAPPRYRFDDLGPGAWTLRARVGAEEVVRRVTLRPGDGTVELDLPFSFGDLTLSGRVVGYRIPDGGVVWLRKDSGQGAWIEPIREGTFAYTNLRPGHYVLSLFDDRNMPLLDREVDLTADQELEIDLGGL